MNDQFQLWLIPPILVAALSFWFRRKLTLQFSWPLLLQSVAVIAAGLIGIFIGPKPFWAIATWLIFIVFLIAPNLYLRKCEQMFATLNADGLYTAAQRVPYFYWGKLGKFWHDIYESYAQFIRGDEDAGNKLLAYWQAESSLPAYFKEQLDATKLGADAILWHWDEIIAEFHRRPIKTRSASLCLQASRAFGETGQFELATQCIYAANLPNQRMDGRSLRLSYLQYFALAGAENYVDQLVLQMANEKPPTPKLILDAWRARCWIVNGRRDEATALLLKLLESLRGEPLQGLDAKVWTIRLERILSLAQAAAVVDQSSQYIRSNQSEQSDQAQPTDRTDRIARTDRIDQIWDIFQRALAVQKIVLPQQSSIAVNILLVLLVAGYMIAGCVDLIDNSLVAKVLGPKLDADLLGYASNQGLFVFKQFYLEKGPVIAGQYYRLVSYLFLHGNLSHLLLNAVGLVWFGRIAATIYGNGRFLIIFFLSGIAGGLAQIVFTDTSAVGASGAIFGIFSAVVVAIFKLRQILPEQVRKRELRWMILMTIAQVGLDRVIPRVAGMAHLGGIAAGLILGIILLPDPQKQTVPASGEKNRANERISN